MPANVSLLTDLRSVCARGVKKGERTPWPIISNVVSATEPRFWVENQAGLIVGGETSGQNGRTAQQ
ncbi:MAG: hypothetical protein CMM01_14080 [Rhodopirellula sp.]|nr:hypothetical protein [Rhodopirellula sp.]MAI72025.1 hypothetical protein [Rhodopirellula sp.]